VEVQQEYCSMQVKKKKVKKKGQAGKEEERK
jgi:hypothetical protein